MKPSTWFITGTSSGFGRNLTKLQLERAYRVHFRTMRYYPCAF